MSVSLDEFRRALIESGLVTSDVFRDFETDSDGVDDVAAKLVAAEKLTNFQAQVLLGQLQDPLVLGNYLLLEKIGEGGMGRVFKAWHRRMERIVALKILPITAINSDQAVRRFHREVMAASQLHHPNIVIAHAADEADGVHFLVMEFVPGRSLAEVVKSGGPVSSETAIDFTLQIAKGLEYAHGEGIVHRDIKPRNLLLQIPRTPKGSRTNSKTAKPTIKILDMGLALWEPNDPRILPPSELTQSGAVMGTVDYMSPEQAEDSHSADIRSDIYSLGCTLYYLLTGHAMYEGDTLVRKLLAHREHPIPSLRRERLDVSERLDAIYQRMVEKSPDDRYPNMTAVVAELQDLQTPADGGPAQDEFGETAALSGLSDNPVLQQAQSQPQTVTYTRRTLTEAVVSRMLIIDDDPDFSKFLRESLEAHGHSVERVNSAVAGLEILADQDFDLILLDYRMPGMSGLEALDEFRNREIKIPVVMMTNEGTSDVEIQAFMGGVIAYVEKPLDIYAIDEFVEQIELAIQQAGELRPPKPASGGEIPDDSAEPMLLGNSPAIKALRQDIAIAASSNVPVLIHGETGTGKELVARAIHRNGLRSDKRFVARNVAAISEELLESELFGHEKGSFTGADRIRKGCFEHADGGTLFLDEIGEMPIALQSTLLRVIAPDSHQKVRRVGSNTDIEVDVRIVCATNRDLSAEKVKGTFREDLYFRLATFPINVPPLRERGDDLRLLGTRFRIRAAKSANRPAPELHPKSIDLLRAYSWPGNVRELRNVLTRAVLRCRGSEILPEHLDLPIEGGPTGGETVELSLLVQTAWESGEPNLHHSLHDSLDRELIQFAMKQCGGNKAQVAERLGLARNTVRKLVQKFGIE